MRGGPFLASLLASGGLLTTLSVPWLLDPSPQFLPSSHGVLPACVCLCVQISPVYKDTSHMGLGPTLMTSFELDNLCKGIPNRVTF